MARLIFLTVICIAAVLICLLASYLVAYGTAENKKRRNWWLTFCACLFFLCAYGAFHYGEGYLPGPLYSLGYGLDVAAFLFLWTVGAASLVMLPFWIVFSLLDRRERRRGRKLESRELESRALASEELSAVESGRGCIGLRGEQGGGEPGTEQAGSTKGEGPVSLTFTKKKEEGLFSQSISRRRFFKYMGLGVFGLFGGASAAMAYEGQADVVVKELVVKHRDLPPQFDGYTMVQVSDIHLGPFIDRDDLQGLSDRLKTMKADRLVITGDLVDEMAWVDDAFGAMGALTEHFPDGVDYILGNHEYFHDLPKVLAAAKASPLHFMRNSARPLRPGDESAYVVGVDYPFKLTKAQRQAFLNKALAAVPKGAFVILLAHHPQFIEEAFERGIALTLAGHTHGGQINVFGVSLVPVGTEYWKGVYRSGSSVGYVNEGTGHWFPIRLNCPREITVIRLEKA